MSQVQELKQIIQYENLQALDETIKEGNKELKSREFFKKYGVFLIIMLVSFLGIIFMWFLMRILIVSKKYEQMIGLLKYMKAQGYFNLTRPFNIAWCAEYPNFTTLLFSRIINKNFPKAVALAYYTEPYAQYFQETDPEVASYYIFSMLHYSELHSSASAQEIICGAWGYGEGVVDCLTPCPIYFKYTYGDVAARAGQGAVQGIFLGNMFFPLAGGSIATSGIYFGAVAATMLLFSGIQTYVGFKEKAVMDEYCNNPASFSCRPSSIQQCV